MHNVKKQKGDYERQFNTYILKCINGTYSNYLKEMNKNLKECSLNVSLDEDIELLDLISSKNDIDFEEDIFPQKLENLMTNPKMYRAIKPLTLNEKLAVFLCIILEERTHDVAKKMGFLSTSSVTRLIQKAIKKIRINLNNMGGYDND